MVWKLPGAIALNIDFAGTSNCPLAFWPQPTKACALAVQDIVPAIPTALAARNAAEIPERLSALLGTARVRPVYLVVRIGP